MSVAEASTGVRALDQFRTWFRNRHDYAKEWKSRTGGRVVGYFCTYAPEELMGAAGILPVRILGSHEPQDVTEPHIFGMFCPFSRDCLAQGLKGRFDYLDGIMLSQSCLHIRNTFNSWKAHVPIDYAYYLPVPQNVQSRAATPYLAGELSAFKDSLETWTGKPVDLGALERSIAANNENRRLMREVYELRKADNPPITGLEAMEMVVSSQMVDKEEHNQALRALLKDLPQRSLGRETGVRLMIIGSEDDDTEFIQMVERVGATIVADDHCTGSRYFWNDVITNGQDQLTDIAARYVDRTPCPTKDWPQRQRFDQIMKFAKEYRVEGALLVQQKFCDPHECDIPPLTWLLNENGIPTLFLEFDVTVPVGQFRTRVEAFLETIREEDLF